MKEFTTSLIAFCIIIAAASADVVCPPTPGDPMVSNDIKNPANCSTFFSCNNGIPVEEPCPAGLEWNDSEKQCDYPEVAQCTVDESLIKEQPSLVFKKLESLDVVCPPGNAGEAPLNIGNPANCSTFYSCNNGIPVLMECPAGLHWHGAMNACNYPHLANCKETAQVRIRLSSYQLVNDEASKCPPVDPEDPSKPVHLPDSTDCSRFYTCLAGEQYIQNCPPGLHWNAEADYCDHPEKANCKKSFNRMIKFTSNN